jgi:hypothetical protein
MNVQVLLPGDFSRDRRSSYRQAERIYQYNKQQQERAKQNIQALKMEEEEEEEEDFVLISEDEMDGRAERERQDARNREIAFMLDQQRWDRELLEQERMKLIRYEERERQLLIQEEEEMERDLFEEVSAEAYPVSAIPIIISDFDSDDHFIFELSETTLEQSFPDGTYVYDNIATPAMISNARCPCNSGYLHFPQPSTRARLDEDSFLCDICPLSMKKSNLSYSQEEDEA